MKIICNGSEKEIQEDTILDFFLKSLDLDPDTVVVECNGEIIARTHYESHLLTDGAKLELIRFVGGG